jgi:hypothetical protein
MTATLLPRLGESEIRLFNDPFLYGYVDHYLPEDLYHRLSEAFIDPATHPNLNVLARGKKRVVFCAPPVPDFIAGASLLWAEAIGAITSHAFLVDCGTWLREHAPLAPQPEVYRSLMDERLKIDPRCLGMQCEFSTMQDGVLLPPHSDSTDKVISFILYFAPPEWRPEWGGATEIYEPRDPRHRGNWSNVFLPASDMRTVFRSRFEPNRLFFFVKGYNAWHGVSPVTAPAAMQRRSFNFSLVIPKALMGQSPRAALEAEIRRLEAGIYAK